MKNLYNEKIYVDSTQIDFEGKLPIIQIMKFLEIATFNHADKIGLDHTTMLKDSNAFWIVTKMKLIIKDYPIEHDKLNVSTWTHRPGMIRFDRDYLVKVKNKLSVKATAEWCCLDATTRKLRKSDSIVFPNLEHVDKRSLTEAYSNLKCDIDSKDFVYTRTVRSTDIDINMHTNNLKYSYFAFDAFSTEELKAMFIKDYEIYFVNESKEGDNIDIYKKKVKKNLYYIEGKATEKTIFRIVIKTK